MGIVEIAKGLRGGTSVRAYFILVNILGSQHFGFIEVTNSSEPF